MTPWLDIIAATANLASDSKLMARLRALFKKRRRLLLLGASGTGKSRFVEVLRGKSSPDSPKRTVTIRRRKVIIEDYPFLTVDTPGQQLDERIRKSAIRDAIRTGVEGVVNLVAFGYHEAAEGDPSDAVSQRGKTVARSEYLAERRQLELDLLAEWVPQIDSTTTRWVLTVVNKADLWWPDARDAIRAYYSSGEYSWMLLHLSELHYVVPYCTVIQPFYGHRTGGALGDRERFALQSHLAQVLLDLVGAIR